MTGSPSCLKPVSRAMISASELEWLTADCFLHSHDIGAKVLAGSPEEKFTEGLDGLRERLKEYYKLGARFTKWRGVYNISNKYPSKLSIHSNAHALARYSSIVQECKMVPIVEPEVLMDGNHSADDCFNKTSEVLKKCFEELTLHNLSLIHI